MRIQLAAFVATALVAGCGEKTHGGGDLGLTATCTDHLQNEGETDVDCGGDMCPTCKDGKACLKANDCASGICSNGACTSCSDGVKNGDETDIDCGGVICNKCARGKMCTINNDCQSGMCGNGNVCG